MIRHLLITRVLVVAIALSGCTWPAGLLTSPYALGTLLDDLGTSGLAVEPPYRATPSLFDTESYRLWLFGEQLQVFQFANEQAAGQAAATIAPDGLTVAGKRYEWAGIPHFYRQGRIIVLFVGDHWEVIAVLEGIFGFQFAGGIVYPDI